MGTLLFLAGVIVTLAQCYVFIGQLLSLLSTTDAIVLNMAAGFIQEVCRRMRLDTMVLNWFKKKLALSMKMRCSFCCSSKEKSTGAVYRFSDSVRAWAAVTEWAPLGMHLYFFFLFGPPQGNDARVHSAFWAFGLGLYIGFELLVEAILQMYHRIVAKYDVKVPLLPLKLPPFPSQMFAFWVVSCGLVAAKQI